MNAAVVSLSGPAALFRFSLVFSLIVFFKMFDFIYNSCFTIINIVFWICTFAICSIKLLTYLLHQQAVSGWPPWYAPAPFLPLWAPKRLAPPSTPQRNSRFPHPITRWPLQLPCLLKPRWVKRPGDLDLWPFDLESGSPSQVWRGLPLCQFWSSWASLFST